ncbi:interleukin-17 receptor D isoform X2 [Oncorhynchus mykiss]|uniref:interleukin-17 receptor D isoform X2 n=1 Tax=Oncorhynchus mykiss TaxID=8022 RepID=UPI001878DCEF|nr:interleukin-17 receptor D isoform X2 [Oncorhynchus mykiss]
MAARARLFHLATIVFLFSNYYSASQAPGTNKGNSDKCNNKVQQSLHTKDGVAADVLTTPWLLSRQRKCWKGLQVQSSSDGNGRKRGVTFRTDNCSVNWSPLGKHAIHGVNNMTFSHLSCDSQAAVVVHWMTSPLGIEHVKGFRVYLEDKNPEGKRCQHMILKDPRPLNFSYKTLMSSQPFPGLAYETDYMVRVVPFPTIMNDSFFPPSFLRTNSCEVLLGPDNLVCKPFWKPKTLNISQLGSNLHVVFDHAPSTFGFTIYYLYYKLRQEGPFRLKRCKPEFNLPMTTCVLQDVIPGTYAIELRDDTNTTRRQAQYHVSQVHSPWAGPIRAMAITVPLVIMSAFATLFTVMCRKKQQENIYSHLDEESAESSSHTTALNADRPWPRTKVFVCYSTKDCPKHLTVVQSFAFFLQDFCGCEVTLDLWEHLQICKEGQMSWLSRQIDEAHYIITVCSKGLKHYIEKSRRGKSPARGGAAAANGAELFIVAVAMIAEKLCEARQKDQDLSRFMAVYFDYSHEGDVPTMLSLAPKFKLMDQLPQMFGRLHSRQLSLPEREPQPLNISKRNYFRSKSGRSLYVAICNMHQHISLEPDWFERQVKPAPLAPRDGTSLSSSSPRMEKFDSGLVLNEVLFKLPSESEGTLMRNVLLTSLPPSLSLAHCSLDRPGGPGNSLSSSSFSQGESGFTSGASSGLGPLALRSLRPVVPPQAGDGSASPPEMPRDSGIYDLSVPSSELSIPLMEGLSPDQADSSSLADSESSSSGLGDEEPPAVSSLHYTVPTICKAELHHHLEQSEGLGLFPVPPL